MDKNTNGKVVFKTEYMPLETTKPKTKLFVFIVGLTEFIAFIIISVACISANHAYLLSLKNGMNVLRIADYLFGGTLGFYVVASFAVSIVMTVTFAFSNKSEVGWIATASNVFLCLSVLSFFVPIVTVFTLI